ncbi:hypothetical protein EON63_01655 [archaeon]|nr:MAG: hypothetical protein EON63_01655 [archaeon]
MRCLGTCTIHHTRDYYIQYRLTPYNTAYCTPCSIHHKLHTIHQRYMYDLAVMTMRGRCKSSSHH